MTASGALAEAPPTSDHPTAEAATPRRGVLAASLLALALLYTLVIGLGDARAWSGSDAGGKVATIRYMAEHHTWVPEVGYWASDLDPSGGHHPLTKTIVVGHRYIQVTSYPFIYLGVPLWRLFGFNGLLVLPVLGSLLAAYAARRLALALGAARGWWAFWLVGAASPMLFYAGDFWEHSMAVGLGLLAVALVLERGGVARATCAGLLAGIAATMRIEVLVYVAAAALAVLITPPLRRLWLSRPLAIAGAAAGVGVALVGNRVFERLILANAGATTSAGGRASNTLAQAGGAMAQRAHDSILTAFGVFPDETTKYLAISVVVILSLGYLAWRRKRVGQGPASVSEKAAVVVVLAGYAARFAQGLGFVSGFARRGAPLGRGSLRRDHAREACRGHYRCGGGAGDLVRAMEGPVDSPVGRTLPVAVRSTAHGRRCRRHRAGGSSEPGHRAGGGPGCLCHGDGRAVAHPTHPKRRRRSGAHRRRVQGRGGGFTDRPSRP